MAEGKYPINIWVNEERFDKLQQAGLAEMCEEMLAGLKVLRVYANDSLVRQPRVSNSFQGM